MNTRYGKIYGPAGLITLSALFLLMLCVGGIAIGLTRGRAREVGRAILAQEGERVTLERDSRSLEEYKARANDLLALKERSKGRLSEPAANQVVVIRRRPSFRAVAAARPAASNPKLAALDIAFIDSAPARGSASR